MPVIPTLPQILPGHFVSTAERATGLIRVQVRSHVNQHAPPPKDYQQVPNFLWGTSHENTLDAICFRALVEGMGRT
jgi:hypothetical protein